MTAPRAGLDPEPLGVAPFVMASRSFDDLRAADLGVAVHPRARAYVFPALGAYVGGDIVAGVLASGMDRDRRIRLFIDIGTNCEILLAAGDRLLATAAPAGPAFEGAAIRCGMRAAPGAVEGVEDQRRRRRAAGHRGRRAARAGRVRAGRRGRGDGRRPGSSTPRGAWSRRTRRACRRGSADRLRQVGKERVFVLHSAGTTRRVAVPVPARHPRAAVRQGGDRHRLEAAARGAGPDCRRRRRRCCWPARSAATSPRPPPCGSASCPTSR